VGIDKFKTKKFERALIGITVVAAIILLVFGIYQLINPQVEVTWSTATEVNTFGYNLLRSNQEEGPFDFQVNDQPIEATGQPVSGSDYNFIDRSVKSGVTYYYLLEEVQYDGSVGHFGPITVRSKSYGLVEISLSLVIFATIIYYLRISR
jgi:hypothetical protein